MAEEFIDEDGCREWYQDGKLHREDGPAMELSFGKKSWFFNGKKINCSTNEEFFKIIKLKAFW